MKTMTSCLVTLVVILTTSLILINCAVYKVQPFERENLSPDIIKMSNEINSTHLLKSSSLITVKPIHSGNIKVPLSNPINLKDPACRKMRDKAIVIPIFAYLVHHDKYGYWLIDSGCDASYLRNPYGRMKGLLVSSFVPKTVMEPGESVENQLSDIRKEIKGIFFTHLHPDHTAGRPVLPENILLVVGQDESLPSIKWLFEPNHFKHSDTVYMMDFDSKRSVDTPLGRAIDIFDDGTLWAISTPGHTKGHVSYLVNTKERPVLVTGDAVTRNECMEIGVGPGTCCKDVKLAGRTFDRIYVFAKKHPQVKIWAGHDYPR